MKKIVFVFAILLCLISCTNSTDEGIYNITYNLNGGVFEEEVDNIYNVESIYNLPIPKKDGYTFIYWIDEDGNIIDTLEGLFKDINLYAVYDTEYKKVIFQLGEHELVKYYEYGSSLPLEIFEYIDGLIYDIQLEDKELIIDEDLIIKPSEYIIYEIEHQTENNVVDGEYNPKHYVYSKVVDNSSNVTLRPYIGENIMVNGVYIDNFNTNIETLYIKEGFGQNVYFNGTYPNLTKIEFENGIKELDPDICIKCPNLKILVLPTTFEYFVVKFFKYCNNLEVLFIRGDGVKYYFDVITTVYCGGPLKIYFEREVNYQFKMLEDGEESFIPCYSNSSFDEIINGV